MAEAPNREDVAIRLLGGFELLRDGRPAARPAYDKGRALLAYLATETAGPHPRQKLAEMLWPDLPAEAARTNLRQVVLNLRRVLGDACLNADRDAIDIARGGHVRIDVAELTAPAPVCVARPQREHCEPCVAQMEGMAACYRGEFMAGFFLSDCPEFEDWLQVKREALHRHALAVLERLSNCLEQAGEIERALPYAVRYTELEPWNEDGQRRAMRLYVRTGQTAAALAQYRDHCRALEQELGVRPDEETRRLAARIRSGELTPVAVSPAPAPAPALPPLRSERRQVTVLYCELRPLSQDDPDEAMAQLAEPQARCVELVRNSGGHVVQKHGGGLLAYFGFPQAREDAARQAVRAALAAVRESSRGLEIRAGVHTGIVIGNPALPDTIGTASGLAIRVRRHVDAGEVAASATTMNLVAGYFDCDRVGALAAQDNGPALQVYRVRGETGATNRLEARLRHAGDGAASLPPFVGREGELGALAALWDRVRRQRRGAAALLQGEAGIGKSRLLLAFKAQLAHTPCTLREIRCFPEFAQTPFQPLMALFASLLDFADTDPPQARLAKLKTHVERNCGAAASKALAPLARVLSLPLGEACADNESAAQRRREETLAALLDALDMPSPEHPALFIAEDLHWADSSTLEFLGRLFARTAERPLLVLMTARPEFAPPWEAPCTVVPVAPLQDTDITMMVTKIGTTIAPQTSASIVARADGVPLFAEEMARMALGDDDAAIPATLQDLLSARLDAMAAAKRVAQLAATIGREFGLKLLGAVSGLPAATLQRTLIELRTAGVLVGEIGSTLQFKHALIQEAAYQSQLKADRQAAHLRIAQALSAEFAEVAETQPEVVARHLALGGETLQAVAHWLKAGQRAFRRSANNEAQGHFHAGLELLVTLPETPERNKLEIPLQLGLGILLQATQGYGSPQASAAFTRALSLCGSGEGLVALFQALWGVWVGSMHHFPTAMLFAQELQELARHGDDSAMVTQAHYIMGNNLFWIGHFDRARSQLEQSIARYRAEDRARHVDRYGEDAAVTSRCFLAWTLWLSGFADRALRASEEALTLARADEQANTLGYALALAAILRCWMRRDDEALQLADEAAALSEARGLPLWLAVGRMVRGWAAARQGRQEGIDEIRESIAVVRSVMEGAVVVGLAMLIDASAHAGVDASAAVAEALEEIEAKGDRHFAAEIHRRKGDSLLAQGLDEEAEKAFERALEVSRDQNARMLELRAAVSMARLWQRQGRRAKARKLLKTAYEWFSEGHAAADLVAARETLEALA